MIKCQITWKSVQWELSCFMRTDRRTAMMKLIVAFRNSAISCISEVDEFFPNMFCGTWYTSLKIQIHCYVSHTRLCLDSSVKNHLYFVKYHTRSAMTKQISDRSLTADTRVQSQVNLRGICGAQSGIKTGLPPGNSILPTYLSIRQCSVLFHSPIVEVMQSYQLTASSCNTHTHTHTHKHNHTRSPH